MTISAIFVIKTPCYDCRSVSPMQFIFMTIKWGSLRIFPSIQSILNWEITRSLNFDDSYDKRYLNYFRYSRLRYLEYPLSRTLTVSNILCDPFRILINLPYKGLRCLNGTLILQTGIACKKISCYMRDPACRWLIVENAEIFRSYVKHFWIFPRERNCRILIGLSK